MNKLPSLLAPVKRSLAHHLSRLNRTLENLGNQLKEAISSAMGQAVAGVVRESVHGVLASEPLKPTEYRQDYREPARPRDWWEEQNNGRWFDSATQDLLPDDLEDDY